MTNLNNNDSGSVALSDNREEFMEEVKDKIDDLRQENKRFCEEQDNIMKHLDKVKVRNKNKDKTSAPSDRRIEV